tara:strand:+ start:296 stop:496 length:201 start_codon:yes stop_codon:yes gene_type:complete
MGENNNSSSGIGLGGMIFIVFLILKLGEIGQVANWSWWWVCSPIWIPFVLIMLTFGIALIWGYITK